MKTFFFRIGQNRTPHFVSHAQKNALRIVSYAPEGVSLILPSVIFPRSKTPENFHRTALQIFEVSFVTPPKE